MSDEVLLERTPHVLTITINRPQARNAINGAVSEQIAAALDVLDADPELRVGVLTGAGGTFCSGMDLKAFVAGESVSIEGRGFAGLVEGPPSKPLIAAVEGWALAGGFELLLACDMIVAADDARFGVPEVRRGLLAAAGAAMLLPQRIPRTAAMEILLTGEPFDAARARELGLVNRVVGSGESLAAAQALADVIAANGPLAVRTTKEVADAAAAWPADERWERQAPIVLPVFGSADAREGATAFAEKRDPVWTGE